MNAVGIDVSKSKSTFAILRTFGEIVASPFEVMHTSSDITHLIVQLKSLEGDTRIVMEHTGRYYEPMALWLSDAGLFVCAVNPKLIKDFGNNSLFNLKTDKADTVKIARYALDNWCDLKPYNSTDSLRRQLKNMNRQFDFYMKQKTSMKNNLIALLDETFLVEIHSLKARQEMMEARSELILLLHSGMLIVYANFLSHPLLSDIKYGVKKI